MLRDWLKGDGGFPEVTNAVNMADQGTVAAKAARDPGSKHYGDSNFRQGLQSSTAGKIIDEMIHYFKP